MADMIIAARLRELRDKAGVSQDEVAEKCEISRVTLARYENGARTPVLKNAAKLAAYYERMPGKAFAAQICAPDMICAGHIALLQRFNAQAAKRLFPSLPGCTAYRTHDAIAHARARRIRVILPVHTLHRLSEYIFSKNGGTQNRIKTPIKRQKNAKNKKTLANASES